MNTLRKQVLTHALFASLAIAAIPAQAGESRDTYAAAGDATAVEVCATSSKGSVPKEKLVKALNRMLDMGDTPAAAKLTKEQRRSKQFDAFWKEIGSESGGG